jgi:replicative DNA helicase
MIGASDRPQSTAGRVPPHDLDAEAAVLAAMLLDRRACAEALALLRAEHFYADANGLVFKAAEAVDADGRPVDIVTVAGWLRDRDRLAGIGGAAYLAQLSDATPAVAHVAAHARKVREKWQLRALIATCQKIAAEGYGDVGDVGEFIDAAEGSIHGVTASAVSDETPTLSDALREVFQALTDPNADPGASTGLVDLDALMGPMRGGQLIIVGAHTGIGKTSLGMQMGTNIAASAIGNGPPAGVLVFSHEMKATELAERVLFGAARVNGMKIARKGTITEDEWRSLTVEASAIGRYAARIWIDDRAGLSPLQIRATARRVAYQAAHKGTPLRMIMVDYLQLLDGTSGGKRAHERREREIAYASAKLKELAKELGIPVVLLSQLNDDANREKRPPRPEDLRESKAAAQDADKVILIHNPAAAKRVSAHRRGEQVLAPVAPELVQIIVGKNRGGLTGTAHAIFFPTFTAFEDATDEDYARRDAEAREEAERTGGRGR